MTNVASIIKTPSLLNEVNSFHAFYPAFMSNQFSPLTLIDTAKLSCLNFSSGQVDYEILFRVLTALRLSSEDKVGLATGVSFHQTKASDSSTQQGAYFFPIAEYFKSPQRLPNEVQILNKEKFLKIYENLQVIPEDILLLFEYYHRSYQSHHEQIDAIVSAVIFLESMILHSIKNRSELNYKLRIRALQLLNNSKFGFDLNKFISILYDYRSKIIHDGLSVQKLIQKAGNKLDCKDPLILKIRIDLILKEISHVLIKKLKDYENAKEKNKLKKILEDIDNEVIRKVMSP